LRGDVRPTTQNLFMTKVCDFPYPIYELTKNFIPYDHCRMYSVVLNIIYEGLLLIVSSIMTKK